MKHMKTYKPFSIIVVPFPFTDSSATKKRPALVLSEEQFQKNTEHVTLIMITSAKHSTWYNDYKIKDLSSTGLNAPSIIRQKIFTLDSRVILEKIGELSTKDKKDVLKIISNHLHIC